jgi:predicted enzyme involved in methoxymalonyl-ACP biosynthesis
MGIVEEISQDPLTRLEHEVELLTREFVSNRKELRKVLSAYGVQKAKDIEVKMKKGELKEHPTYEDYLSALQLEMNLKELRELLREKYSRLIEG